MINRNLLKTGQFLLQQQKFSHVNKIYAGFARQKFSERRDNMKTQQSATMEQQFQQQAQMPEGSAGSYVSSNAGLNDFITRVYKTSGLGITGALFTSQAAIFTGLPFMSPMACSLGGFAAALIGIFGTRAQQVQTYSENINGHNYLRTQNSFLRYVTYSSVWVGLGLSSSPLFAMAHMQNPIILPTAIGISAALFGGASVYAYTRPKDSLISWGSSLQNGLIGLIGLQLAGVVTSLCIGPNLFSTAIHRFDTIAGIGLFSALIAYDTHCAIKQYEEGDADHLMVAIELGLDFWNILVRMVQVLSMFSRSD